MGPGRSSSPKCIILETMEDFCAALTAEIPPPALRRLAQLSAAPARAVALVRWLGHEGFVCVLLLSKQEVMSRKGNNSILNLIPIVHTNAAL